MHAIVEVASSAISKGLLMSCLLLPAQALAHVPDSALPARTDGADPLLGNGPLAISTHEHKPRHSAYQVFRQAVAAYFSEDYAKARKRFRTLADSGHAAAQYYLALIHDEGRGVPRDAARAAAWYRRAARQGHVDAQYNLGVAYASGSGVPRSLQRAVYWWRRAAEQGSVDAQFNLGLVYYLGQGVSRSPARAFHWWQQAARHGDPAAQFQLGMLFVRGEGTPANLCAAQQLWQVAARQGYRRAGLALQAMRAQRQPDACGELQARY